MSDLTINAKSDGDLVIGSITFGQRVEHTIRAEKIVVTGSITASQIPAGSITPVLVSGRFRKKPVEIEAVQWFKDGDHPAVVLGYVFGKQGDVRVDAGDFIIPELDGSGFYPCKPDVFEATYEPVAPARHHKSFEGGGRGLSFGQAIEQAKAGNAIARDGWNGKGMFVVLMPALYLPPFNTQGTARKVNDRTAKWIGEDAPLDCQPYFAMFTANKQWQPGWLASQADMLAEDWAVVQGAAS